MKIVRITLLSAVTLILSASCSKMDDIKSDEVTVGNVRELGSPVTNPTHSEWCKPETAEKTLSSVRHIADNFYKMNFQTDLHLKEREGRGSSGTQLRRYGRAARAHLQYCQRL